MEEEGESLAGGDGGGGGGVGVSWRGGVVLVIS